MQDLKNIRPGMPYLHDDPFMAFWHVISDLARDPEVPPPLEPTFMLLNSRVGTPKKAGEMLRLSCVELQYIST